MLRSCKIRNTCSKLRLIKIDFNGRIYIQLNEKVVLWSAEFKAVKYNIESSIYREQWTHTKKAKFSQKCFLFVSFICFVVVAPCYLKIFIYLRQSTFLSVVWHSSKLFHFCSAFQWMKEQTNRYTYIHTHAHQQHTKIELVIYVLACVLACVGVRCDAYNAELFCEWEFYLLESVEAFLSIDSIVCVCV